jgi:hypothetical protein
MIAELSLKILLLGKKIEVNFGDFVAVKRLVVVLSATEIMKKLLSAEGVMDGGLKMS